MQFDFTLPANGGQIIDTKGSFVKYVSGTGKIRVRIDRGSYLDLMPGQGARGLSFDQLRIEDRSGAGNVGVILAGAFEFQDDRISGTVDTVDGGKARTLAGNAFCAAIFCGGQPGQFANSQLWNPPGSGKILIVESFGVSSPGASSGWGCDVRMSSQALTTVASNGILSKKSGGTGSAGQLKIQNTGALPAGGGEAIVTLAGSTARDYYKLTEPIVLLPGAGLLAFQSVAAAIVFNAEWYEEAL